MRCEILRSPIPRQQIGDVLGRMVWQSRQHVGEPGARIDAVELGGLDERVDGGGAASAFVGTREGPVVAADRNPAQRPLGGVVGQAEPAVVEEAGRYRGTGAAAQRYLALYYLTSAELPEFDGMESGGQYAVD